MLEGREREKKNLHGSRCRHRTRSVQTSTGVVHPKTPKVGGRQRLRTLSP